MKYKKQIENLKDSAEQGISFYREKFKGNLANFEDILNSDDYGISNLEGEDVIDNLIKNLQSIKQVRINLRFADGLLNNRY